MNSNSKQVLLFSFVSMRNALQRLPRCPSLKCMSVSGTVFINETRVSATMRDVCLSFAC